MNVVPLQPIPNQTLQIQLNGQPTTLNVYQLQYGLFVDVLFGAEPVIQGVLAHNLNWIVRSAYLGFDGDLTFFDTQGEEDPTYAGLGDRFVLIYFEAAEALEASEADS